MTDTEIANLALAHLRVSAPIGNLLTEKSQEANSIRPFMKLSRDLTLRDFEWPFATQFLDLGLVSSCYLPEFKYAYRYPSNCIKFRRLVPNALNGSVDGLGFGFDRSASRDCKIPYRISSDLQGNLILTNFSCVKAEITWEPPAICFPPDFYMAQSYRLAMYVAKTLTGGDPYKLGEAAAQMYLAEGKKAQANSANEEQKTRAPEPELISARGGGYGGSGGYEGNDF